MYAGYKKPTKFETSFIPPVIKIKRVRSEDAPKKK